MEVGLWEPVVRKLLAWSDGLGVTASKGGRLRMAGLYVRLLDLAIVPQY
jgi:hypothetical protein